MWNRIDTKNKGKYLELIDALQESGRKKEKERCLLEARNKVVNPDDPEIIPKLVRSLQKWFGRTNTDKFFDGWKEFVEFEWKDGETIEEFLIRYDMIDSKE